MRPIIELHTKKGRADPEQFPTGMKSLSDYVIGSGLQMGLYSTPGN